MPNPTAAEKAFKSLRNRLLALDPDTLVAVHVDLAKTAIFAAGVARFVNQDEVKPRFLSLPEAEFERAHVADLEAVALAAWHVAVELQSAGANDTEAKLPASLVKRATEVRARMIKLLEYHLGDDPAVAAEIASIKQGAGYADLASDLVRLAKLYQKHHEVVASDTKHYVTSDLAHARTLAQEILKQLGDARSAASKEWTDLASRAWTLLLEVYGEVSAAGRWLFRRDGGEEKFPSLYAVGRRGVGRPKKAKDDEVPPNGETGGGEG